MKRIVAGLIGMWLLGNAALALGQDEVVISATQLVEKSKQGRNGLIEAVSDVKRFVEDFTSKEELVPYLLVLDELARIQSGYDIESLGSDPTKSLSLLLTRYGAKWIEFDNDGDDVLEIFFRWAESSTRYNVTSTQVKRLNTASTKAALMKWHGRIQTVLDINRKLKSDPPVIEKLEELQSVTIKKLLGLRGELTHEEVEAVFRATKAVGALSDVLGYLDQEVLSTTSVKRLKDLVGWTLIISGNVKALGTNAPYALTSHPGKVLIEASGKLLDLETGLDEVTARKLVAALVPAQVTELGASLQQQFENRVIPEGSIEFLWAVSKELLARYSAIESQAKQREFEKFFQRLATMRLFKGGNYEGTYEVVLQEKADPTAPGRKGILTIAAVGASNFSMSLNVLDPKSIGSGFGRDYNFFDVIYDLKKQSYVAQYRSVESPKYLFRSEPHWHLKFDLAQNKEGKWTIAGEFFDGTRPARYQLLTGVQTEAYPRFPELTLEKPVSEFTGTFSGNVEGSPLGAAPFEMIVTQTGSSVGGKYYYGDSYADIPFEWGHFSALRNSLQLTTGEFPNTYKWVHVRGVFSNDGKEIRVYYILSGWGIKHVAVLKKVE